MEHATNQHIDSVAIDWGYYSGMVKRQLITLATVWVTLLSYSGLQNYCHETRYAMQGPRTLSAWSQQCGALACKLVEPWR